jgi:hypothetical protein
LPEVDPVMSSILAFNTLVPMSVTGQEARFACQVESAVKIAAAQQK